MLKVEGKLKLICFTYVSMYSKCWGIFFFLSESVLFWQVTLWKRKEGSGSGRWWIVPSEASCEGFGLLALLSRWVKGRLLQRWPSGQRRWRAKWYVQLHQGWAPDMGKGIICRFVSWEPNWSGKLKRTPRDCHVQASPLPESPGMWELARVGKEDLKGTARGRQQNNIKCRGLYLRLNLSFHWSSVGLVGPDRVTGWAGCWPHVFATNLMFNRDLIPDAGKIKKGVKIKHQA